MWIKTLPRSEHSFVYCYLAKFRMFSIVQYEKLLLTVGHWNNKKRDNKKNFCQPPVLEREADCFGINTLKRSAFWRMDNIRQSFKLCVNAESVSYKYVILNIFSVLYFDGNMSMFFWSLANFQSSFSHCRLCFFGYESLFLWSSLYFCWDFCSPHKWRWGLNFYLMQI